MLQKIIKIKTWAELNKTYGLTEDGEGIDIVNFTKKMEGLLPTNRIIVVNIDDNEDMVWIDNDNEFLICSDIIDKRKEYSMEETNLINNRKMILNSFDLEATVKINNIISWDLNVSFSEDEIIEMLLQAIDTKINKINS